MGLCSIRVASKTGKDSFAEREKVMNYLPSSDFDKS
jgi:hypothetical protein